MTDQNQITRGDGLKHQTCHALFAICGRIGRLAFIAGFPIVGGGALSLVYVSIALAGNDQGAIGGAISATAFLLALAALWPLAALLAKRLHDLNRSGWHSVWIVALWLSPDLMPDGLETLAMLAVLATLLALAALPGTSGANAYGNLLTRSA
jgi:uncharacterized membrane protein YhaH (DUF805 family)